MKDEDEWRWGTQCPVTDVTYLPFPLGEGCVILRAEAVPKTQTSDWMWLFSSLCRLCKADRLHQNIRQFMVL